MSFMSFDVFDRALFAGGDDEALLALHERNFGDLLDGHEVLRLQRLGANVDESSQAIVLAEIAARVFVASGAVLDLANGIESDESGLLPVLPQAQRLPAPRRWLPIRRSARGR